MSILSNSVGNSLFSRPEDVNRLRGALDALGYKDDNPDCANK